jgi:endonuclease/exonuclease/phosphatase family metal-dependent hydrolase
MPEITDAPPADIAEDLRELRAALDDVVPAKRLDNNLIIGTWNIREFGGLTDKWRSEDTDSPKRDLYSLRCITEIVSRLDVVALQEVQGNLKALRHMLKALGPEWGFIMTDVTRGHRGGNERMAFVFDTRRVRPSGLACELVVPEEWLERGIEQDSLNRQFARTPYAVSFLSAGQTFILVTLHVFFGEKPQDRIDELSGIAEWMADWARQEAEWNHNLIALGDFNIDRRGDPNYEAFVSRGLSVPDELQGLPRTIFYEGEEAKHYDQVAWFTVGDSRLLTLHYGGTAGNFDFTDLVLTSLNNLQLSYRISDHFPLWAEFGVKQD